MLTCRYDKTADEIAGEDPSLAILPIGSVEQHGPHLPVGTDWYIAGAFGDAFSEASGGFLLPPLPISTNREHMGKKGAVWMDPDTFYRMLSDILHSLREQGFRRVVTLQCHGGIFVLPPLIRQINATCNPGLMAVNVDICNLFSALRAEGLLETDDLHSGEAETSLMLAIARETVHMDRAVDCVPAVPRSYLNYGSIFRASPSGVWGQPSHATAEKGRKILQRCVQLAMQETASAFHYMEQKKKLGYSSF